MVAGARKVLRTLLDDVGCIAQRLDIIDDGRASPVSIGYREWRTDTRDTALAFERFDQGRFLSADIGAGAHDDLDIEVDAVMALDVASKQVRRPAPFQSTLDSFPQEFIFVPQVDVAARGTDRDPADRHAFDQDVGVAVQQCTVLKGAGFALVGIANDVPLVASGLPAQVPFSIRMESSSAAASQVCSLEQLDYGIRADLYGALDGRSRGVFIVQKGALATQRVVHYEPLERPFLK